MTGVPLRPIVSSKGTITSDTPKGLARILKPLVSRSPHHVHNTRDYIQQINDIKLEEVKCIHSYDVKELYVSVPIEPALRSSRKKWNKMENSIKE